MKIGHDPITGNPYGAFQLKLAVREGGDNEGLSVALSEWFNDDDGEPIDDAKLRDIEELLSTRLALARQRCVELNISDADLVETVEAVGRRARLTPDDYDLLMNIVDAAAAEQNRRNVERATPAARPASTPTSE